VEACRRLVQGTQIEPAPERPVWALDGTVWPRPAAKTSPERTYGHRTTAGIPQDGVVPAREYEWLVAVPAPGTGWVLPLDVERRGPSAGTPTAVAIGMLRAIRGAGAGEVGLPKQAAARLLRLEGRGDALSERETEVLCLVARGLANKQIARDLGIASTTVKCHVGRILAKLGLPSRTQLALYAARTGLVARQS
jgi:DNA-binding CsgD family transcriptional regulator